MPKKAQDFLVDTQLGEASYKIEKPAEQDDRIVLSIEEGAVPASMLKEASGYGKSTKGRSLFKQIDDAIQGMGRPQPKDKATFFRLMAIMINAGIPLIKALDTVAEQTGNQRMKNAIFAMARAIEKGGTFSDSMAQHPDVFADSHIGMIRSGEVSGQLNNILKQLAVEVEKSASITRKVKGALMYPAFIMVVVVLVVAAMMIFVVPKMAEIFSQSGNELPLLTRIVISTSNFMIDKWAILLGLFLGSILAFIGARRTEQGKYTTDWILINIPVFGQLVQKSILARFSRSLGNLLTSGVPIIQGLVINAGGLGNEVYKKRIILASEDLAQGIPLGESLRDSPEFPTMMVQMISVGEQTAQLDNISVKIAEYYEDEVDTMVAGLSKVIEPLILIIVGGIVGLIIGAVMLPIIQLTQVAGV
jgi:type IV pilus assembly protein PilC